MKWKRGKARRAQISLEFMLIIAIGMILIIYSVREVTFSNGTSARTTLQMNVYLEEKRLASSISNTISQVYSQGPGSKATAYVHLTYINSLKTLKAGLGIPNPVVFITYGSYVGRGNGTFVTVASATQSTPLFLNGTNKSVFWSLSLYPESLYGNSSLWSPSGSLSFEYSNTTTSFTVYGVEVNATEIPSTLRIVITWNPQEGDTWTYVNGTLFINIKVGG